MRSHNSAINYLEQAQKRREKQEREDANIFQPKQFKFFSDKNNSQSVKMFYHKQEHKFTTEDIPSSKLKLKKEIKDNLAPDVLELRKPKWNSSTLLPIHPEIEEPHERKLWKIKLGLADGHNVPFKSHRQYQGVETRNIFGGWEQSTLIEKKRSNFFAISSPQYLSQSVGLSMNKNRQLLPSEYRTPKQRQFDYTEFMRQKKVEEQPMRSQLRDIFQYDNPGCSLEKLNAGVQRLNYETKLKAGQLKQIKDDTNYTFTPDISRTVRRNQIQKSYHSGIWNKFTKEKENGEIKTKWAYSCCLNEDQDSLGCNKIIVDRDKRNIVGFLNS